MLSLLTHLYKNAEAYTVLLSFIVIPLGFWESFHFMKVHYGIFKAPDARANSTKEDHHAADRHTA
jgi:hypothetical protein